MKSILLSIKPKYVSMILNNIKTIEVRKRFPSDYVGWVYIYCTKDKKYANLINRGGYLTGMVVARFWCKKVEEISYYPKKPFDRYGTPYRATYDLLAESCLEYDELDNYLNKNNGYAIQITELEIFDKPKEISEFKRCLLGHNNCVPHNCRKCPATKPLTRVPQSYCFIEI